MWGKPIPKCVWEIREYSYPFLVAAYQKEQRRNRKGAPMKICIFGMDAIDGHMGVQSAHAGVDLT